MPTWAWILIAVAALVVLGLLVVSVTKGREKVHERKRAEADELRLEADTRLREAGRREAVAGQEAERARAQQAEADRMQREAEELQARARREEEDARRRREEAEQSARRADEIDPDAPDPGDDFDAEEALRRERTEARPGGHYRAGEEGPYVDRTRDDDVSDAESRRPAGPDEDDHPGAGRA